MAIITKPAGGVLKGIPATFTLSKVELLAVPMVSADSYFSDSDNWNKVILKYKSSEGKQYEVVEFNATLSSPTGTFSVSEKARDEFEIQTLEIIDFDGGIFIVPRADLTAAEFDIDFGAGIPQPTPVLWLENPAYVVEGDGGATASATRGSYGPFARNYTESSQYVTGDFIFEAEVSSNFATDDFIGLYDSNTSPAFTTGFNGLSTWFEQTQLGYTKPTGSTYFIKIQRVGLNVKFFVNNVEVRSATHTDIAKAKCLFFTFYPGNYIVSASLTAAEFDVDFNAEPPPEENYILWNNTSTGYLVEADGGATTTASRPSGPEYDIVYANSSQWVTGDFAIEWEVSQNSSDTSFFAFYSSTTNNTITTGFNGLNQIRFLQTIVGGYSKPAGDTFKLKITRTGLIVKFFVNNVVVYTGTQTEANYDQIKVPFFSMRPDVYIVKTTIEIPEVI